MSKMNRRAFLQTAALAAPAVAVPAVLASAATVNPDAEILAMGAHFDALCTELDATPVGTPGEDAVCDKVLDAAYGIAGASAVTIAGIKVKVRAALWLTNWEGDANPTPTNGADEEITLQVFRFVRALEG